MMHMHHNCWNGPCACTALRKASRAVSRLYDDALSVRGMSTAQFAILRTIAEGAPLPLSRLAEQLVLDRTSLYRAIAPLEAKRWVAVTPGPGKSRLAALTLSGKEVLHEAEADWRTVQARLTGAMGQAQWSALEAALRAIMDVAQEKVR